MTYHNGIWTLKLGNPIMDIIGFKNKCVGGIKLNHIRLTDNLSAYHSAKITPTKQIRLTKDIYVNANIQNFMENL